MPGGREGGMLCFATFVPLDNYPKKINVIQWLQTATHLVKQIE